MIFILNMFMPFLMLYIILRGQRDHKVLHVAEKYFRILSLPPTVKSIMQVLFLPPNEEHVEWLLYTE